MRTIYLLLICTCFLFCSNPPAPPSEKAVAAVQDSVLYSFAFLGCNREGRPTNPSTANIPVLNAILKDLVSLERTPDAMFFLGDLVLGETDTATLDRQLSNWVQLIRKYHLPSAMEIVALPGNHELLKNDRHHEFPLYGTTPVWMRHMAQFMPSDREKVTPDPNGYDQMTFAFSRKGIGFVAVNTDTYNQSPGTEGMINKAWVEDKIRQYCDSFPQVFVLTHKPAFSYGVFQTGHAGFPDSRSVMGAMQTHQAVAMCSAHAHDYQRWQPFGAGPYQIVAGNGGSPLDAGAMNPYFGYSIISVLKSGKVLLRARGLDNATGAFSDKDVANLIWK